MSDRKQTCDESRLSVLVFGDDQSDEYRDLASHVELCQECRNRLIQVAADDGTWNEICDLLAGYPEWSDRAEQGACDATDPPPRQDFPSDESAKGTLDFLSPPRHPEMLGRLGRYEIEGVIGSGGMGVVLKGYDTELSRPVAIKVLARHLAHSGAARQRFAREARAAAAVVHEHVIAIHNVESDGEMPFLVMQYVSGLSVQARVDREGPLDAKEILRIGTQAAAGLAAAHEQGVVHRDVKPGNILLENGVERALLTDFGLARTVDDASLTHTGIVAGTPHYMSPEQAGGETTDHRSDLFSLGSVLYFMATGRPPFRAERAMGVLNRICHDRHRPVWAVNPDIPDALSDIIDRLLAKNPRRRYSDAGQVRQALSQLLAQLQQRGPRRRRGYRRFFRRHRRSLTATAVAATGIALVAAMYVLGQGDRPEGGVETPDRERTAASANRSAAWTDASAYSAALRDVEEEIQLLETNIEQSTYLHLPHPDWSSQLDFIRGRLDRLSDTPFVDPTPFRVEGDEK